MELIKTVSYCIVGAILIGFCIACCINLDSMPPINRKDLLACMGVTCLWVAAVTTGVGGAALLIHHAIGKHMSS